MVGLGVLFVPRHGAPPGRGKMRRVANEPGTAGAASQGVAPMPALIFYIAAALTVGLLVIVTCLLTVVARGIRGDGKRNVLVMRIDASERLMRDDNEALRSRLIELDQGLRKEVSVSTRDGFERAFDKVQEGSRAQSQ